LHGVVANTSPGVKIIKGGLEGTKKQNTAEFVIQSLGTGTAATPYFNTSDFIFFTFDVDNLLTFEQNGSLILSMEASVPSSLVATPIPIGSATLEIARSSSGVKTQVGPNTDPQTIAVDVTQDYKKFLKGATSTTTVNLGYIFLGADTSNRPRRQNGSSEFNFLAETKKSATFTITNGIFSASKGTNAVFLDLDGDEVFGNKDIAAVISNDTTAVWTLNNEQLDNIADYRRDIIVVVDGTTTIVTQDEAPMGTLEFRIDPGKSPKVTRGRLRHIKDNGSKCTLYNIPDGTPGRGSLDGVSVRFTNKSSTRTGNVYGEMFDEKGVSIYGSRKLLAAIEPNATVRFNTGEGGDLDLTYGQYNWAGQRARLYITTDLQDIEVFGLVRNTQGGPNMNVSTGATGNGCVQ
jgi:hypothetical protein